MEKPSAPILHIQHPEIYVEATDYQNPYDLKALTGVKATDANDQPNDSIIVINDQNIDYRTPGDYEVSVSASDQNLNMAIRQITVHVVKPQDEPEPDNDNSDRYDKQKNPRHHWSFHFRKHHKKPKKRRQIKSHQNNQTTETTDKVEAVDRKEALKAIRRQKMQLILHNIVVLGLFIGAVIVALIWFAY